ncbi:MAG TPA: hypothetical protein VNX21_09330, partial [Candidatus Thermoplasmatota archaeon]|nr:hypothetical protein [Candidatus Thermoplasmatota archaeon]
HEKSKLHPDLRWIISVPIKDKDNRPIAVLNVDGLESSLDRAALERGFRRIPQWCEMIHDIAHLKEGRVHEGQTTPAE